MIPKDWHSRFVNVLRRMPFSRRTSWVNAEAACRQRRLDPKDVFRREGLIQKKKKSPTRCMCGSRPPGRRDSELKLRVTCRGDGFVCIHIYVYIYIYREREREREIERERDTYVYIYI